jgi:hypothetical protein
VVRGSFSIGIKIALYFALLLIISVFVWSRMEMVPLHFTHYDDLYAPYLFTVIWQYDPVFFSTQLEKYGGSIGSVLAPVLLDFFSNYPSVFAFLKGLLVPIAIAKTSTFAPLQFYLTALIADFDTSYTVSKVMFRLPSTIFSFLTVLMLYQFSKKLDKIEGLYIFIVGGTVLTASWMFLIYSSQGENFAAGVFSLITMIYLYEHYKDSEISVKDSLKIGLFLSLLCLLHYQSVFFLPSFFLAMFYESNFSIRVFIKRWVGSIFTVSTTLLFIYYIFLKDRLKVNPGVHWNAGPDGQYAFNSDCGDGLFSCAIRVFTDNFFEVFQSTASFSNLDGSTSIIYTVVLMLLTLCGIFYLYKQVRHRGLLLFFIVGLLVWVLLVLMGKLTFSPTRHSLILLTIIAILSSLGLYFIVNRFGKFPKSVYMAPVFSIAVLTLYIFEFDGQKHKRIDPLEKINIQNIIDEYNLNSIVTYSHAVHLEFYPEIKSKYDSEYFDVYPYYMAYSKKLGGKKEGRILLLCVNGELCNLGDLKPVTTILDRYYVSGVKYKLIFSYIKKSNTLNGFGSKAGIGPNELYISIWEIDE